MRKDKYYGTDIMLYGEFLNKISAIGYKGSHSQFRIVCKAKSMAEANRICDSYGLGKKVFESNYTSETGNSTELELADKYKVVIATDGTCGGSFIGIEDLLNVKLEEEE